MKNKPKDIISKEHQARGLEALSAGMAPLVKKLLGDKGLAEIDVLANWTTIAGEELAQQSLPQKIEFKTGTRNGGTLYLLVASGAFAVEIQHKTPLLIEKINTFFGYQAVAKIKIVQNDAFIHTKPSPNVDDKSKKKLVTADEQNYIDMVTKDVRHPQLQECLRRLGESIFKNNN